MLLSAGLSFPGVRRVLLLSGCVSSLLVDFLPVPSQVQITLDGTLGPKGPLSDPNFTIDVKVGRQVGWEEPCERK